MHTCVHKLVYLGSDGVSPFLWRGGSGGGGSGGGGSGGGGGEKAAAHALLSNVRWLNEEIAISTGELARKLEENGRVQLLLTLCDANPKPNPDSNQARAPAAHAVRLYSRRARPRVVRRRVRSTHAGAAVCGWSQ